MSAMQASMQSTEPRSSVMAVSTLAPQTLSWTASAAKSVAPAKGAMVTARSCYRGYAEVGLGTTKLRHHAV